MIRTIFSLLLFTFSLSVHAKLELVAKLHADVPPGNIAVSAQGRIFLAFTSFMASL